MTRGVALALLFLAASASAQSPTAEQERLAVVQLLQTKLPGTKPADWIEGAVGAQPGVAVIALSADNATNTHDILAIGKKAWERKLQSGKTLANCFPQAGRRVAANYPQVDAKSGLLITLEGALRNCLQTHGESEPLADAAMGPLVAYVRSLSDAQRVNVKVPNAAASAEFEAGRQFFYRRIGQQDFACASCHLHHAGKVFGDATLSPAVGQAVTWPRVEAGGGVRTLHAQFQRCMIRSGAEPEALGSTLFNQLEYYLTYLSNNLPIRPLLAVH